MKIFHLIAFIHGFFCLIACSKGQGANPGSNNNTGTHDSNQVSSGPSASYWVTQTNQSKLLQKQADLHFGTLANQYPFIDVDSTQTFQVIDGFGYTLTGGSATLINQMSENSKSAVLQELFSTNNESIGISYLRLSVGSSDLNASVFSYDDMPSGQTDSNLQYFNIDPDRTDLIPVLKKILAINPSIKIIATAWSAPSWMKTNSNTVGGSLKPGYFSVYAKYYVKYIQAMMAEGIHIDAITPQNEPLNPNNNPSMVMSAADQLSFIKNDLGPALQAAGLDTKIVAYDHNCDVPEYPLAILSDIDARKYVDGSAFHLYAGDISALSRVHNAYPDKNLYFTEQYTASTGEFAGDLKWHLSNVIIGSMRNWSRSALEWNLANDPSYNPHTPGGCTTCKGALTINGNVVARNVAYYIIAHASKFVEPGSVRIASNITSGLQNVAFKTPSGKKVLIVENDGNQIMTFNIRFNGKWITTALAAGAVATYNW
jgi:glucosylceramidase